MNTVELACRVDRRRDTLLQQRDRFNGIDYVEVLDGQLILCVHFFGDVPALFDEQHPDGIKLENVRISGGRRIRDIRPVALKVDRTDDPEHDDCLRITLDKIGDFSIYKLCLVKRPEASEGDVAKTDWLPYVNFDPRYQCAEFSFKVDCPSDLDCKTDDACPPTIFPVPEINYLAKDYASFRQLMLDRLAVTIPDWQERHVPDLGITLVEVLAYAADHLSYYQDAVATEAYLNTARQRISVRRHARLVDYNLHEGTNARAWVSVWTSGDTPLIKPNDFYFITGFDVVKATQGNLVKHDDLVHVSPSSYEVFEVVPDTLDTELKFFATHSEMRFYTWGDTECCLPAGATRATLLDGLAQSGTPPDLAAENAAVMPRAATNPTQRVLHLKAGDVLIFEEVIGPNTGNSADANPLHRHAIRLTEVVQRCDALLGNTPVLDIEWAPEDALPFSLCLSSRLPAPDCRRVDNISVARGNVVLVDHGRTTYDDLGKVLSGEVAGECACDGSVIETTTVPGKFAPTLPKAPVTFAEPVKPLTPARSFGKRDPHRALPQVWLSSPPVSDDTLVSAANPQWWFARTHLLDSSADDKHFVAELEEGGRAHLRFGDGELGMHPEAGAVFRAKYRVGNGPSGNVGRESIAYMVLRRDSWSGLTVQPRNPIAASGGVAPEIMAEAKLLAPHAFRSKLMRAITAADYATISAQRSDLQGAAARLRWTGSWYDARVAIDPLHVEFADETLCSDVAAFLYPYRRIGHDLDVVPARYIPLDITLRVCVLPHHTRGEIKAALLAIFSNRDLGEGRVGFFHPDRLRFGGSVYLSQIVAAAQAVEGVESVVITRLQRRFAAANGELESGALPIGELEVAQLDNDPNFPEHGRLALLMGGGR